MTALVIGASGLVGSHLMGALRAAGEEVVATSLAHPAAGRIPLDLRDEAAVRRCLERCRPDTIYLPASLTHVDYCQAHPGESFATNVGGVRHVVTVARPLRARIVYFSSDYVFAGDAGPYAEDDPVRPLSVYGQHKVLAEMSLPEDALIVRTTVVYGPEEQGKNFVIRLRGLLAAGQELRVPSDQVGSPTFAPNLARAAVTLARSGARGIFHVAGPERASRYEFALEAARVFGLRSDLLRPVSSHELDQIAPRPLNAGMRVERAQAQLPFPLLGFREGLRLLRDGEPAGGPMRAAGTVPS
jgi:dTDP-4-dehydrorhamnose reductase